MVTIKDVARAAKVSVATVSRTLNGSGPVREETGRRVRDVVQRLKYVPHTGARSLITNRTDTLGVVLPALYGEFFSEVIRGMDESAQRHGFHLLISSSHADKHEVEGAMRAMRGRVDGVIVMFPDLDAESFENIPKTLPLVRLCSPTKRNTVDSLTIDNCRGAREMVRHLIALGHRQIAMIKGPARNYDAAERLRGYRLALDEVGIKPLKDLERDGDFTEAGGYRAALELLALEARPTAIFAANDSMAIGALSVLREANVKVPDDIALAGFDDIPLARYMDPPLASVRVPLSEIGERAVEMLVHGITHSNDHIRQKLRVRTELVIRRSCCAPPAERPPPRRGMRREPVVRESLRSPAPRSRTI